MLVARTDTPVESIDEAVEPIDAPVGCTDLVVERADEAVGSVDAVVEPPDVMVERVNQDMEHPGRLVSFNECRFFLINKIRVLKNKNKVLLDKTPNLTLVNNCTTVAYHNLQIPLSVNF